MTSAITPPTGHGLYVHPENARRWLSDAITEARAGRLVHKFFRDPRADGIDDLERLRLDFLSSLKEALK